MPYIKRNEAGDITGWVRRKADGFDEYVEGEVELHVPQDTTNSIAREYLNSSDWYVTRSIETGVAVPDAVTALREEARLSVV